jgi:hypothetical protein
MMTLEEVGRVLDEELQSLRKFFESEVIPSSRRAAVEALRTASQRLHDLAAQLETSTPPDQNKPR